MMASTCYHNGISVQLLSVLPIWGCFLLTLHKALFKRCNMLHATSSNMLHATCWMMLHEVFKRIQHVARNIGVQKDSGIAHQKNNGTQDTGNSEAVTHPSTNPGFRKKHVINVVFLTFLLLFSVPSFMPICVPVCLPGDRQQRCCFCFLFFVFETRSVIRNKRS